MIAKVKALSRYKQVANCLNDFVFFQGSLDDSPVSFLKAERRPAGSVVPQ